MGRSFSLAAGAGDRRRSGAAFGCFAVDRKQSEPLSVVLVPFRFLLMPCFLGIKFSLDLQLERGPWQLVLSVYLLMACILELLEALVPYITVHSCTAPM